MEFTMKKIIFGIFALVAFISFLPGPLLSADQPESAIVEINQEGMQQPPFGTYLSFIRTQDGRIYGVEDLAAFNEMNWKVGDKVFLESVANVIHDETFPQSKVLLNLKNQNNDQAVTAILLKHPISRYLHSSIDSVDQSYTEHHSEQDSDHFSPGVGTGVGPGVGPRVDVKDPFLFNVRLLDGRIYGIKGPNSLYSNWKSGDAIEEDYVVQIEKGYKGPQVVVQLRNLSQNNEAEAVLLENAH